MNASTWLLFMCVYCFTASILSWIGTCRLEASKRLLKSCRLHHVSALVHGVSVIRKRSLNNQDTTNVMVSTLETLWLWIANYKSVNSYFTHSNMRHVCVHGYTPFTFVRFWEKHLIQISFSEKINLKKGIWKMSELVLFRWNRNSYREIRKTKKYGIV